MRCRHGRKMGFRYKALLLSGLLLVSWAFIPLTLALAAANLPGGGEPPGTREWRDSRDALRVLEGQEKEVLGELFRLGRLTTRGQARLQELQGQLERTRGELARAEQDLSLAESRYLRQRDRAARLLRLIQQMGAGSYIEVLVGARTWKDFTVRLKTVAVAVKATLNGISSLKEAKKQRARHKEALLAEEGELAGLVRAREEELYALADATAQKERLLAGLGQRKGAYMRKLEELERNWVESARPFVQKLSEGFAALGEQVVYIKGIKVYPLPPGWRLVLPEDSLNRILAASPGLEDASFRLEGTRATLVVPGRLLSFTGKFSTDGEEGIVYQVEGVEFAGLPLGPESMADLFRGRRLAVNLGALHGGLKVKAIEVVNGALELTIIPGSLP